MEILNDFSKEQLQLLIALVSHSSFSLVNSDNLALEMVNFDYAFEHFAFQNPADKRKLASDPTEYMSDFVAPVLNPIINHYEGRFGKI